MRKQLIVVYLGLLICGLGINCSKTTDVDTNSSSNGFNQITVTSEIGIYYVEYPSAYKEELVEDLDFRVPYVHLILHGPTNTEETIVFNNKTEELEMVQGARGTSVIYIRMSCSPYLASERLNMSLAAEKKWTNFQLIKREDIIISEIKAELVEYVVDKLMPVPVEDGENLWYCCEVYFNYDDLLFCLETKCDLDIQEQVKADINHIIETFKILD